MPKTYEYNKKYVKTYMAKFERIGIKVPKGKRELLKRYAEKHSKSLNELINRLIDAELGGAGEGKSGAGEGKSGAGEGKSGGREHDAT